MNTTATHLKRMKIGGRPLVLNGASVNQKAALYRLAYRLGITISIKKTPDGTKLWRTA